MNLLRDPKALLLLAALAVALGFAACTVVPGNPPGGTDCRSACLNLARATCGRPEPECTLECLATAQAMAPASDCRKSFEEYVACLALEEEPGCVAGSIDLGLCREQRDRYRNACLFPTSVGEACTELPERWEGLCGGAKPVLCRGAPPDYCRPGGGGSFPDLYCCGAPGQPDGGTSPDGGGSPDGGSPPVDSFEPMVRACLFGVGCGSYGMRSSPVSPVYSCVQELWQRRGEAEVAPLVPASRAIACGRTSTDCASFASCMTLGHAGSGWCGNNPGTTCDGNLLVTCGSPSETQVVDCAAGGNSCRSDLGTPRCVSATGCTQVGSYCPDDQAWTYCNNDGFETTYGCQAGERCRPITGAGAAQCYPEADCQSQGTERCDGAVVRTCATIDGVQNVESSHDCAAYAGGVCRQSGTSAYCDLTAPECAGDSCDGKVMVACVMGHAVRQDCTRLGFSTCGLNAHNVASCQ